MHSSFEQHPGLLIHDIVRLFRRSFGERLRDLALSEAQWRALGTVHKSPGISQTELAEQLDIGKAPMGVLIDKLEAAGLLQRQPDPVDRRIKRLSVTASAIPITATMRERYEVLEQELLRGLSKREHANLDKRLRQVYGNLAGIDAKTLVLMQVLIGTQRLFARHFDIQLKELGFTRSQWLVLATIKQNQGMQQSSLAGVLYMKKAPLGVIIDELENGGWVERRTHPSDRRARQLFLTSHCKQQWPTLTASYRQMHEKSLLDVAPEHRQQLGTSLQTIRDNLQAIVAPADPSHRNSA